MGFGDRQTDRQKYWSGASVLQREGSNARYMQQICTGPLGYEDILGIGKKCHMTHLTPHPVVSQYIKVSSKSKFGDTKNSNVIP